MIDISIIIVNYNGKGFIEDCLESVRQNLKPEGKGISYGVIIVDNASSDGSLLFLEDFCRKKSNFILIKNAKNVGFGSASNIGADKAEGKFLLFLNPDCRILEGDIGKVIDFYQEQSDAGALGVKVLDIDGSLQLSPRAFPTLARQFYESYFCSRIFRVSPIFGSYFMSWWDHLSSRQVDWLSGSFILIRKKVFIDAGGFDRDYFMYSEDTDLCLELVRRGYKNYYYPHYAVKHADAGIASRDMARREAQIWESRRTYFRKNYSKAHGIVFSLIYLSGTLNRIIIFGLGALFKGSARKRVAANIKSLYIYYCKRKKA
jgi:GT2 family glycosyltransferase